MPEELAKQFIRTIKLFEKHAVLVYNNKLADDDFDLWSEYEDLRQNIVDAIISLKTKNPFRKF